MSEYRVRTILTTMSRYRFAVSVAEAHVVVEAIHENENDTRHAFALIVPMIDDYQETVGFLLRDPEWDSVDPETYEGFEQHYSAEDFIKAEKRPELVDFWLKCLPPEKPKKRRNK